MIFHLIVSCPFVQFSEISLLIPVAPEVSDDLLLYFLEQLLGH